MSSKTKIVVFKMKELIYTAIFIGLGILLVILLIYMFSPGKNAKNASAEPAAFAEAGADKEAGDDNVANEQAKQLSDNGSTTSYIPGIYTSTMVLNGQSMDIAVTVDADHINGIEIINLNDAMATMFPLIEPALEELTYQIKLSQNLSEVSYSEDSKFTSQALLKTIQTALNKAKAQ